MRVLFVVSDCSYPAQEGLHQQTILLISALRDAGCEVTVVGYLRRAENLDQPRLLSETGTSMDVRAIPPRYTLLELAVANRLGLGRWVARDADRNDRRRLAAQDFDVVHLEGIAACSLYRRSWRLPVVLSFVDPGSRRQLRMFRSRRGVLRRARSLLAAGVYFAVERSLAHPGVAWHVVSEGDRDYLARVHRHPETYAIPVLDLEVSPSVAAGRSPARTAGRLHVVVLGDLRQEHMRSAFERLVATEISTDPRIVEACDFTVVGRVSGDPGLQRLSHDLQMRFVDWVEDYPAAMRDADVVILPDTVGTGLKNRAVQALSSGTTTIGTEVAFEGLSVRHAVHALVADGSRSIGGLLREVLDDPAGQDFGPAASALVDERHAAVNVIPAWLELYRAQVTAAAGGRQTRAGRRPPRRRRRPAG